MLPGGTVLIEGQRIKSIGSAERPMRIPRGARVIDGRGKYVIPGLIDAHVHLVHVLDFANVTGDEILPLFLANGVTAVRDTGDEIVAEKLVGRYAERHPELCPRVFLSSPLIDRDPPFHPDAGRAVTDPDKVPEFVDDMVTWGVSTLKIYVGTGRAVGRRVIEEGHRRGLAVTAHLGNYSAQEALEDGIDCLEHIWSVFDYILPPDRRRAPESRANVDLDSPAAQSLIAELARRRVFVDPTLAVHRNMLLLADLPEVFQHPDNRRVPARLQRYWLKYRDGRMQTAFTPETLDLRRREFKRYQELVGRLHRAGVPLLAGTDTAEPFVPPGFSLHQELEFLVESGLSPAAALQAATIQNARALKQAERLGSIEEGKLADLVILDADPLADIRNTRKIFKILKEGRVLEPRAVLAAAPIE